MTTPYPTPLPESPLSINYRVPEVPGSPQFTLRAASGAELEHLSADVAQHAAAIGRYLTEFRAGLLASVGVQAEAPQAPSQASAPAAPAYRTQDAWQQPQPPSQSQYQAAPAAPQTGGVGQAPTCPHGQRVYRTGVSQKTGKPYKMWVCPAPQGDPSQCKPEWA